VGIGRYGHPGHSDLVSRAPARKGLDFGSKLHLLQDG